MGTRTLRLASALAAVAATLVFTTSASAGGVPYASGDVFAGVGNGMVFHYDNTGVLKDTLNTGSGSVENTGMCFDGPGNLYVTNWTAGSMTKFDNAGNIVTNPWGGPFSAHPEDCIVDASGNIYEGEVDGSNRLMKYDASGTLLASWNPATEDRGIDWIDLAADQSTIYYTSEGSAIHRFDVSTGTQLSDFATGLSGPCYALRIRSNGEVLAACSSQIYRLDATGAVIQTYSQASLGSTSFLFAMNLDPDGKSFWTADYSTGLIDRVDIATGAVITSFTAPPQEVSVAGIAIFGEPTVAKKQADLSLTKSGSPDPVVEGSNLTYTLTVTNNGPDASTGASITDVLPAGETFVSSGDGCTESLGTVTCPVGALANGASTSVSFTVTAPPAGTVTNTASVTGNEGDPDPTNNTGSFTSTVQPRNHPPVCTAVTIGPALWPPNHKLVLMTLTGATDPDGNTVTMTVNHVTQDEPLNGLGDGDTGPVDAMPAGPNQVYLRAERSGKGDGRVYVVSFTASDGHGGTCTGAVSVGVPHDQSGPAAVNSGQIYTDF